jgi:hypothetical protein
MPAGLFGVLFQAGNSAGRSGGVSGPFFAATQFVNQKACFFSGEGREWQLLP